MASEREGMVVAAGELFAEAADVAGPRLAAFARVEGLTTIKEKHLQKEFKHALEELAAATRPRPTVSPSLSHGLKHEWPRLGLFDISLRWGGVDVFGEVKCGEDALTLSACGWDAAKEAFCLQHGVGAGMVLMAAAPVSLWEARGVGIELFFDGEWDMDDIRSRYAAGFRKWEGDGYKPDYVFRRLRTFQVSRSPLFDIAGRDWCIGIARVEPVDDERLVWVPFRARGD